MNDQPRGQPSTRQTVGRGFPETRWSLVLRAQTGNGCASREALAELCESYWFPLYGWLRHRGDSPEDAEDIVQGWFAHLIQRDDIAPLVQENGKLRSFFLTSLKNYSIKQYEKARALKRGGAVTHLVIDSTDAEARYACEPTDSPRMTPDRLFDRAWATLLLEQVFAQLRSEYEGRGAEAIYETLKSHIPWNAADRPLKDAAEKLGMREGAVRVAVVRLRKRFRRILEKEILQTVGSVEDLEEEIGFLHQVFSM